MDQGTIWDLIEGGSLQTETGLATWLATASSLATTAVGDVWTIVTGNVWMQFLIGVSVLMIGFRFLRRGVRLARGS